MPRPIAGSSVLVTGASSGIGYCAAVAFARRGASLTLAARDPQHLRRVAGECRQAGAEVVAVPTDVADADAVERLAAAACERFGGIDTWVNCAAVMAYGRFEQLPADVFERVIETNFMGQVHGSRAALPRFRDRGAGVLINLSSVWGRITTPLVAPYVASKHAIRAFSECLRHELADEPEIHVTTILPEAVDTPIFAHAGNYTGRRVRPIPPMVEASQVARGIVACAESPKREVTFGRVGRSLEILYALLPRLYCRIAPPMFSRGSLAPEPADARPGNVEAPMGGAPSGGWRAERRGTLVAALRGALAGAALGLAGRGARGSR
jgi:short-subunit dehydrogenase